MANSVTVKDSVTIKQDLTQAYCKNGCEIKYARKLINDWLKEKTPYKGGWTVWFDHDDGTDYWFKLTNPYLEMHNVYKPLLANPTHTRNKDKEL